jgi:hypothetical protein
MGTEKLAMVEGRIGLVVRGGLPESLSRNIRACAHGSYQQSLLLGIETWSGSSLRGKAKKYGLEYSKSRASLIARIRSVLPEGWTAGVCQIGRQCELVLTDSEGVRYVW